MESEMLLRHKSDSFHLSQKEKEKNYRPKAGVSGEQWAPRAVSDKDGGWGGTTTLHMYRSKLSKL